jgi:ABC-type maltose transport system permease subunit
LVFFWFNPLLYIIRYSIKLNHEFLADQSVIKQGISTTAYQELILQHATSNYQHAMANTFHFPVIKKRFNIMKTKTSKTSGLLRSLAIIPIITLLILSCGQEETEFEIENQKNLLNEQELIIEEQEEALSVEEASGEKLIVILNNQRTGEVSVNGLNYSYKKEAGEYSFFDVEGVAFDYKSKGFEVIEIREVLEEVTQDHIKEYNRLARKHKAYMDENNSLIVWKDETAHMQTIFNSMNEIQRANNEPWPYLKEGTNIEAGQIPPPPPPAPAPPPPPPPKSIQELVEEVENGKTKIFINDKEQSLGQLKAIIAELENKESLEFFSSRVVTKMENGVMHYKFSNISLEETDK